MEEERRGEEKPGGRRAPPPSLSISPLSLSPFTFSTSASLRGETRWPVLCHVAPPAGPFHSLPGATSSALAEAGLSGAGLVPHRKQQRRSGFGEMN